VRGSHRGTRAPRLGRNPGSVLPRRGSHAGAALGLLGEAQFSNYPFFLNNIVRSSLLAMAKVKLEGQHTVRVVVVVAKARMFPSANSTLYYEQAEKQLSEFYGKLPPGV